MENNNNKLNFLLPTPEIKEKVRKEFGLDEKRIQEAVKGLKKWLELQPHLPNEEDDGRLERWLLRCKNNMEKTKQTLDQYYSVKAIVPELMTGWDVDDPGMNSLLDNCYGFAMPKLTSDCDRVCLAGFRTTDSENVIDILLFKMLIMSFEIRMCEDYYCKDILILDGTNVTLSHCTKFGFPAIQKMIICGLRGYNMRVRSIHFYNVPTYGEVLLTFIKKCVKKKIADRIYVHNSDLTELYKHVPKCCLPAELGGTDGTIKEHFEIWVEKGRSYREFFQKQEKVKSDESKRPNGQKNSSKMFGIEGSFRQLSID